MTPPLKNSEQYDDILSKPLNYLVSNIVICITYKVFHTYLYISLTSIFYGKADN